MLCLLCCFVCYVCVQFSGLHFMSCQTFGIFRDWSEWGKSSAGFSSVVQYSSWVYNVFGTVTAPLSFLSLDLASEVFFWSDLSVETHVHSSSLFPVVTSFNCASGVSSLDQTSARIAEYIIGLIYSSLYSSQFISKRINGTRRLL